MGLTSGPFTALMIAAAAVSLAAMAWAWPRLARPWQGRAPATGRGFAGLAAWLAVFAFTQAVVICAFLVWLNGYFEFYGSWANLLGTGRGRPLAVAPAPAGAPAAPGLVVQGSVPGTAPRGRMPLAAPQGKAAGPAAYPGPRTGGELLRVNIRGQRTGLSSGPGFVYLPPQYFQPAYARTRFPVVLALTGFPGEAPSIVRRLGLPTLAGQLIAAGRIRPAVYVMLSVSPLLPLDTECTDIPAGPQVESFYAQDVPAAIEHAFRVTSDPHGWGVLGYSTGGYCATKLVMTYPSRFTAAVSMAGYYDAERVPGLRHQWGDSRAYRNENSPDWRLRHLPAPPVSVLVTSSRIGELTLPGTLAFLRMIHPPMRGYSLIVPEGGHNFRTWSRELPPSLEWLSHQLR